MLQANGRGSSELTEFERTIVALLAQGQTVKCIGDTISITPTDVSRRILNCRHKLDARNNAELVANAISSGQFG